MNSIHQVVLGAACVGGAFLLGHYLNHSADSRDEQLAQAAGETKTEWQPSLLEPTERKAQLPSFRNSTNLEFDLDEVPTLPPPSQLAGPGKTETAIGKNQEAESGSNSMMADDRDSRSKSAGPIEVPDFSELANQFRGSPLELPRQTVETATPPSPIESQDLAEIRLTPIYSVPRYEESFTPPVDPDHLDRVNEMTGSSQFTGADFAPRLNETVTFTNQYDPPQTSVLEINAPQGVSAGVWQDERGERSNRVISYSDPFPPLGTDSQPNPAQVSRDLRQPAAKESTPGLNHHSLSIDQPIGSGLSGSGSEQWNRRQLAGSTPSNAVTHHSDTSHVSQFGSGAQSPDRDTRYSKPVIEVQPPAAVWQGQLQPVDQPIKGAGPENQAGPNPGDLSPGLNGHLSSLKRANVQRLELNASRFHSHPVVAGESLASISTRYYGKPEFYLDIYLANQTIMRNPGDVRPGMVLKIPVYQ